MMKKSGFLFLAVIMVAGLLYSCDQPRKSDNTTSVAPSKELNTVFDQYAEERLRLYPLEATENGDKRYDSILPNNISQAYMAKLKDFYTRYLDALHKIDRNSLNRQDQLSYDVFEYEMKLDLEQFKFKDYLMPINQFWSLPITFAQLGSGSSTQTFMSAQDYENFMRRMQGFSVWTDTAIANMRKGLALNITHPRILMERVLPQLNAMMVQDVKQSIFYEPIKTRPKGIDSTAWMPLKQRYETAIQTAVIPSYTRLYKFIKDEYIPKLRTSSGISEIPNGKEYYRYLVHYWTTTDMTPDEIFNVGEKEVARITSEMEKVKAETGFQGDLKSFFHYVNTDPKFFPFHTAADVINRFKEIKGREEPNLPKLFDLKPKTPFEIRQTEAFRAASASAEYQKGSADGTRPGIFYVPVLDATKYNYFDMESLFLHEAIPGHHYQISIQQENKDLPAFRRNVWYGAFGEGWALYCEGLGKDLGLYTDPYQYFGRLSGEIHRAIRLVVDVGMHEKGWTREQAIAYMMQHEATDSAGAVAEIERYMAIPGQALAYKTGELKILEMRKKAQAALGDKFDIRAFHRQVLIDGPLPLQIFEKKISDWIAEQKGG